MKIVIAARHYTPVIGGHIVLHKLCDSLLRQGLPAYLRPDSSKKWHVNPAYLSQVTHEFNPGSDIAIYHNSIEGNPWNARRFIRWMLYVPVYETDGVVLYISPMFGPGPVLRVIEPYLEVFRDYGTPRTGMCWTWRKAEGQGWKPKQRPKSGTHIPRGMHNDALARVFNAHERFVSYDGATFLSVQAALCGCDSIVPRPVGDGFPWPGIALSEQDIPRARAEHGLLRETLEREYREQDARAAEVIQWAIKQF